MRCGADVRRAAAPRVLSRWDRDDAPVTLRAAPSTLLHHEARAIVSGVGGAGGAGAGAERACARGVGTCAAVDLCRGFCTRPGRAPAPAPTAALVHQASPSSPPSASACGVLNCGRRTRRVRRRLSVFSFADAAAEATAAKAAVVKVRRRRATWGAVAKVRRRRATWGATLRRGETTRKGEGHWAMLAGGTAHGDGGHVQGSEDGRTRRVLNTRPLHRGEPGKAGRKQARGRTPLSRRIAAAHAFFFGGAAGGAG